MIALCLAAGISKSHAYELRQRDEDFALRWADAIEEGTERLEEEARRRAMDGSDTLLIFLLKARRPRSTASAGPSSIRARWDAGPVPTSSPATAPAVATPNGRRPLRS